MESRDSFGFDAHQTRIYQYNQTNHNLEYNPKSNTNSYTNKLILLQLA